MKKSLIVNNNKKVIEKLNKEFLQYLPKENAYEKIATLGSISYDYVYVVNFKDAELEEFTKLFKNREEEFFVDNSTFENDETIVNICIAFNNANYQFKKDIRYEYVDSKLNFLKNTKSVNEGQIIASAIECCKNYINEPSNYLSTTEFTKRLEQQAQEFNLDCKVYYKEQLEKAGAGGILAVNQGSKEEARVVQLKYNGGEIDEKPIILVGKGIVFDAGGYSLKPTTSIVNMKSDMGGAAVVAAVITAVSKLKLPINIISFIPITDNLINSEAYRPDDIITFLNGLTAEIISTDAEGRLILADALSYAHRLEPELIIDVATLTGAVINALGATTTGVFGNNTDYINSLINTTNNCNEYAWHLPINDTHRKQIKGNIATLKNSSSPGGACTAAAFLENFVGDSNWIHIDIAGSSWDDKNKCATGSMVRPLIEFLKNIEVK